ncbi:MAG: AAA family ATPase [Clostridium butyricum]
MITNKYDWMDFYKEFAEKLLVYKGKRQELVSKVKKIYENTGINLPTLEKDNKIIDIDPFTVFGLFNKSSMKEENRIKIISAIAELFNVAAKIPTAFNSIPVLNNQNATFYYFVGERAERDIDDLWELFEAALDYSFNTSANKRQVLSELFDLAINKKGNGNSKITMGLYWIAPNSFLNLDQRNTWYIYKSGKIPANLVRSLPKIEAKIPAIKYFDIVEKLREYLNSSENVFDDFKDLSSEAWRYSELVNQENKLVLQEGVTGSKAAFLRWMKPLLQALKDLGGSAKPQEARKKIIENEQLSEEEINIARGKNNVNKFENEVAFARNYLVYGGYIDKSVYGVWTLTESGKTVDMTDELASELFKKNVATNQTNRDNAGTALADEDVDTVHYWIYSPGDGAFKWEDFYKKGVMGIGWSSIGDLRQYENKNDIKAAMKENIDPNSSNKNATHATWQFVHDMKRGDVVFVKKGMRQLVGRGVVESDYYYNENFDPDFPNLRKMNWTNKGEWEHPGQAAMKALTDITSYTDYVKTLCSLFDSDIDNVDIDEPEVTYPSYSAEKYLEEVFMSKDDYETLVGLVKTKKNVILQGAPGVGKTYAAKRLAYSIMGVKDQNRVMMVQFHQSYSYEDLIEGYRPTATGFEIKKGSLYKFCKKATDDLENDYFFIIDEINRGNLSKIFGELFMLIESDKRGNALQLLYSDEKFFVPKNVYIIGMMNTADRSLAMLDYALRRRFAFYEMKPGFSSDGFREYRIDKASTKFDTLINCVENLNGIIGLDDSLGEGFCIGHSYFCNLNDIDDKTLSNIIEYELIPLLKEYWFDEPNKVRDWSSNLRGAIK